MGFRIYSPIRGKYSFTVLFKKPARYLSQKLAIMITDVIGKIKQMKEQLKEDSCVQKEPFIKLGSGKAPALNYNIPQSACFNTYGNQFVKGVSQEAFLPHTRKKPAHNYFDAVKKLPEAQLVQRFADLIRFQQTDDIVFHNSALLAKHLKPNYQKLKVDLPEIASFGEAKQADKIKTAAQSQRNQARLAEKKEPDETYLAGLAKKGLRPMLMEKLGGYEMLVKFVKEPEQAVPYFTVIEEYTTCSFLGDYGAGKTLKTFSLLPGEKTTITVRSFQENSATRSRSENVLDSFSESSTNALQQEIENETALSNTNHMEGSESASESSGGKVGGSAGVNIFGIVKFGAEGGYNTASASTRTNATSATRASNVRSVNKALSKHVANSNANRSIDINTSTTANYKAEEETTNVREIANINKSRVLNFVFRQLLQQYVTITYLSNIKVAYCNGYEESLRVVDLEELDILLEDTIQPDRIDQTRQAILKPYCTVFNYLDKPVSFVEEIKYPVGECVGLKEEESFWRIRKEAGDVWQPAAGGLEIKVKGPILNVTAHTLKTSSTVADAFLGQGEALDCFNAKAQDAVIVGEQLKNVAAFQQLETIDNIKDAGQRAELYPKVFGRCEKDEQQKQQP